MDIKAELDRVVAQVATDFGLVYVKNIKAALATKDKLATGALYNSINYNVDISGIGVHLAILALDYLKWVDLGRRPGTMPPVTAILEWIQSRAIVLHPNATVRRNILGRFSKGFKVGQGRNGRGQYTSIVQEQTKIAWAIAVSIKQKGIPATNITQANDSVYAEMQNAATNAAANAASKAVSEDFAQEIRNAGLQITTTY